MVSEKNKINYTFACDVTYILKDCGQHSLLNYYSVIIKEKKNYTFTCEVTYRLKDCE